MGPRPQPRRRLRPSCPSGSRGPRRLGPGKGPPHGGCTPGGMSTRHRPGCSGPREVSERSGRGGGEGGLHLLGGLRRAGGWPAGLPGRSLPPIAPAPGSVRRPGSPLARALSALRTPAARKPGHPSRPGGRLEAGLGGGGRGRSLAAGDAPGARHHSDPSERPLCRGETHAHLTRRCWAGAPAVFWARRVDERHSPHPPPVISNADFSCRRIAQDSFWILYLTYLIYLESSLSLR